MRRLLLALGLAATLAGPAGAEVNNTGVFWLLDHLRRRRHRRKAGLRHEHRLAAQRCHRR